MDDLDLAILRQLSHPRTMQWNVRPSYADLGRALKADEETVRLRVRKMQDLGVLAGWEIAVHPALLGHAIVRFDLPVVPRETHDRVAAALCAMDGARMLFEYYGGRMALVSYVEPGPAVERYAALLQAIAGVPPHASAFPLPPPTVELDATDWRIVHALRKAPRAPYAELADALGMAERTLRRRVDRMVDGRALYLDPQVDLTRVRGVACVVRVLHAPDSPREAIDAELQKVPNVLLAVHEPTESRISFLSGSVADVDDLRRRLGSVAAGKARVEIDLALRRVSLPAWLDEQIARRAEAGAGASPP